MLQVDAEPFDAIDPDDDLDMDWFIWIGFIFCTFRHIAVFSIVLKSEEFEAGDIEKRPDMKTWSSKCYGRRKIQCISFVSFSNIRSY